MQENAPVEEAWIVSDPFTAIETFACWANLQREVDPVVYVTDLLTSLQVETPAS